MTAHHLRAVPDGFEPPAWQVRYVADFRPARPGVDCPRCAGPVDDEASDRPIGFAVKGGQRLCETCLYDEIPAPLIEVAEHLGDALGAVADLSRVERADRTGVLLSAVTLTQWVQRCLREALP